MIFFRLRPLELVVCQWDAWLLLVLAGVGVGGGGVGPHRRKAEASGGRDGAGPRHRLVASQTCPSYRVACRFAGLGGEWRVEPARPFCLPCLVSITAAAVSVPPRQGRGAAARAGSRALVGRRAAKNIFGKSVSSEEKERETGEKRWRRCL